MLQSFIKLTFNFNIISMGQIHHIISNFSFDVMTFVLAINIHNIYTERQKFILNLRYLHAAELESKFIKQVINQSSLYQAFGQTVHNIHCSVQLKRKPVHAKQIKTFRFFYSKYMSMFSYYYFLCKVWALTVDYGQTLNYMVNQKVHN